MRAHTRLEGLIEGDTGQPGQAGQQGGGGVMGRLLARFAPTQPPAVAVAVPVVEEPETSPELPSVKADSWDEERAAAIVAEVDALIDAALAPGGVANTQARRNVLANERGIIRAHVKARAECVWTWADSVRHLLTRWK